MLYTSYFFCFRFAKAHISFIYYILDFNSIQPSAQLVPSKG